MCIWIGQDGKQGTGTTSEAMPVKLCTLRSKHSSAPDKVIIEESSGKGLPGEALLDGGCPLKYLEAIREEALVHLR